MKKLFYGLLLLATVGAAQACPFTFINDTRVNALIVDITANKRTEAKAGMTTEIPGAIADSVWVYEQSAPGSGVYKPAFRIVEMECVPAGAPLPTIRASTLPERAENGTVHEGIMIMKHDKKLHPEVKNVKLF